MTAEIAILNKSAVVLAADSAVTISVGSNQEKTYDSADKLFELSCENAIGVMVNGDLNFVQVPLSILIKRFRSDCKPFLRVSDASEAFLAYLAEFGRSSRDETLNSELITAVQPVLTEIKERSEKNVYERLFSADGIKEEYQGEDGISKARADSYKFHIAVMLEYLGRFPDAEFIGAPFQLTNGHRSLIQAVIANIFGDVPQTEREAALNAAILALTKAHSLESTTGVIIAGYGKDDLFPTLISIDLHGIFGGALKIKRSSHIDIDREGDRARVVPFAQREMVERFLYGLDGSIQRSVTQFCRGAIPSIRQRVLDHLDMTEADRISLEDVAIQAENAFYDSLDSDSFEGIRQDSRSEIEDMVEFMPKPEMARMAEALVNLTSIKRRVTRGMETVGGPIDVAVISQAEGFVWVKRKHYFSQELNSRYFDRKRAETHR